MQIAQVREAIAPLTEALRADGADLHVTAVGRNVVRIQLDVRDSSCADCVMPQDVLESLLLDAIVSSGQPAERVELNDPRVEGEIR